MCDGTRVSGYGTYGPYSQHYYFPQDDAGSGAGKADVYGPFVPQQQSHENSGPPLYAPTDATSYRPVSFTAAGANTSGAAVPTTQIPQADMDALKLDLTQMGIDLVGIVDPTPISDGSNTVISLFRGNWKDAAISAVAMVPYVGDAAKLAKLPKYVKVLEQLGEVAMSAKGAVRDFLLAAAEKIHGLVQRAGDFLGAAGAKIKEVVGNAIQKLRGPSEPPPSLGPQFDPNVRGLQQSVDPRSVPQGSQQHLWNGRRLTPEQMDRVRRVEQHGMDIPVEVQGGKLIQGNHRLYISLGYNGKHPERMRPIDVYNHG
jgi:hypothetical protein